MDQIAKAVREKLWTERTTDEKLSALRDQCIVLSQIADAQSKMISKLQSHDHSQSGVIMVKLDDSYPLTSRVPTALRDRE